MTTDELKKEMGESANVTVVFTKKNGTERVMKCTRNFEYLLANVQSTGYVQPIGDANYDAEALGMVRVWDLEEQGWRTITAATVSSVAAS